MGRRQNVLINVKIVEVESGEEEHLRISCIKVINK